MRAAIALLVAWLIILPVASYANPPGPFSWNWDMSTVEWITPTQCRLPGAIQNNPSSIYTLYSYKLLSATYGTYSGSGTTINYLVNEQNQRTLEIPSIAPGESWSGIITYFDFPEPFTPLPDGTVYYLSCEIYAIGRQNSDLNYEPEYGTILTRQQWIDPPVVPEPSNALAALLCGFICVSGLMRKKKD